MTFMGNSALVYVLFEAIMRPANDQAPFQADKAPKQFSRDPGVCAETYRCPAPVFSSLHILAASRRGCDKNDATAKAAVKTNFRSLPARPVPSGRQSAAMMSTVGFIHVLPCKTIHAERLTESATGCWTPPSPCSGISRNSRIAGHPRQGSPGQRPVAGKQKHPMPTTTGFLLEK